MREYIKEWSNALGRDMEALRFGTSGLPLLVFPTSLGRFYQWEDFGMINALRDKIDAGFIQVFCVDSVDAESWYAKQRAPRDRVQWHLAYERYLLREFLPRIAHPPVTVGSSFGALHAVLTVLRHPARFNGFIALSGAFDTRAWIDGYFDQDVYYTNPMTFLPGLSDDRYLTPLRRMEKRVIATGAEDRNVDESIRIGTLLREKGVDVTLDIWPGWSHDWPYWMDMMRKYV
ncbi:MAG TPA: prolyl oligopeptidase family serine peptidase [Candidatus Dormibacteraeota bacterium]|nr:prolyl oligopeptidase family serine peptidase [Candidatus Dormibacteraeota bacterium]